MVPEEVNMRDEQDKKAGNPVQQTSAAQTVERVGPSEFDTVARILAVAYNNYPLHIWAMPNAATRLADAAVFFKFYLKRMRPDNRDVFVTSDRSAVVVSSIFRKGNRGYPDKVHNLPTLFGKTSPVNDYFEWIETFRPNVDHRHNAFLASLPEAPRGTGFFLLSNVLKIFDREGLPVWTWSTDPLILPFHRRLGFQIGDELRRDNITPPATLMWRPPMPVSDEGGVNDGR